MSSLTLLLSAFARQRWGDRIQAAAAAGDLTFVTAVEALAAKTPCADDIAFTDAQDLTSKLAQGRLGDCCYVQ